MVVIGGMTFTNSLNTDLTLLHENSCFRDGFPETLSAGKKAVFCVGSYDKAIYKIEGSHYHIVRITIGSGDPGSVEIFSVDRRKMKVLDDEESEEVKKLMHWKDEGLIKGIEPSEFYEGQQTSGTDGWELVEKY
ncbi:hypothetical protein TWF281_007602 [Arthrobotrys megalospora]